MRMDAERLSKFIGKDSISIVDAMGMIDANSKGILFLVDNDERLSGSLTDGDIRRWIMKSEPISAKASEVMNASPKSLSVKEAKNAINVMKQQSITAIPIVDDNNRIVDAVILAEVESHADTKGDLSDVPVVVMAGGKGTRLYPYTKILPKPLVPIGDTPIVERIINYYTDYGMKNFYMTINYKRGMIRSYFDDIEKNYSIKYIEETKPLGTGGSVKLIEDKFDRPIFVTNCDALILADYYDIYKHHLKSGNDITMVSALKNFQVPYGVMHTGENGVLESMEEKPKLSYFINTGMYIINPETIDLIPDDTMFHMTHLVDKVMKQGGRVGTYPISEDSFLDMGELNAMKRMEEKLGIITSK